MARSRGPRPQFALAAGAGIALTAVLAGCTSEQVEVGTCAQWDQLAHAPQEGVQPVDCTEEHTAQFVGNVEVAGAEFPGDEAIDDAAEPGCLEAFAGFVGTDYADSELRLDWFRPSAETWGTSGGREVWCVAYLPEGTTTESFEGSGR